MSRRFKTQARLVMLDLVTKKGTSNTDINDKLTKITEHKIKTTGHKRR